MKSAYLEVWSDMLGSLGVIAASIVIHLTGWAWVDSLVAAAIGIWVLPRTWVLLKDALNILLQGVPRDVDLDALEQALMKIDGIQEIHNLHVWALTTGRNVLSVHVVGDLSRRAEQDLLVDVDRVARDLGIPHTTVQVEVSAFHDKQAAGKLPRHDNEH